jgi:hypothetical protein
MSLNSYLSCCILLSLGMLYVSFSTCKMIEILFSDSDFTVTQCVIKLYRLFSNSICIQLNRHLLYGVIYLLVAMNLYKYVSCIGELEYSHTTSSIYLFTRSIPVWNGCPFYHCGKRAQLVTFLAESTYGRRYWVCSDDDLWFEVSLFISNLRNIDCGGNNTLTC